MIFPKLKGDLNLALGPPFYPLPVKHRFFTFLKEPNDLVKHDN